MEGMLAPVAAAPRGWRLAAVFVLALAVVGMHSMGSGHHGATAPADHGSHQLAAGVAVGAHGHQPTAGSGSHHDAADPGAVIASETVVKSEAVVPCLECLALGEDALGAMCLAVLSSLLALALLLTLRHLSRGRAALMRPLWSRVVVALRSPLRRMALSPIEVCVLRT